MTTAIIFRPLQKWPGTPTAPQNRSWSPFSATYTQTMELLERELKHLGAVNVVIECQVLRSQIRGDGWMKANTPVQGPAVILTFKDSDNVQYSYPCDSFNDWQANLRAIALSLEALRKIDRYGVTRRGEQYHGFKQLPAAEEAAPQMQPPEAAAWIAARVPGTDAQVLLEDRHYLEAILKLGAKRLHPDKGGSHEDFVKLQEAGAVITKFFDAR